MSLKLTIKQAQGMFFDRQQVLTEAQARHKKTCARFGAFVRTVARRSMRRTKKVSAPGDPPSAHVGLIRDLLFFAWDAATESVVIGPVAANKGTNAPALLELGGETTITIRAGVGLDRDKVRRKRVTIAARPFMAPAEQKGIAKLPSMLGQK